METTTDSPSPVTCPSWCTGEHAFLDQHDGPGFGKDDRVCVLASAAFGDGEPYICLMLGTVTITGSLHTDLPLEAARDLLALLDDPAGLDDAREALRAAVTSIEQVAV